MGMVEMTSWNWLVMNSSSKIAWKFLTDTVNSVFQMDGYGQYMGWNRKQR